MSDLTASLTEYVNMQTTVSALSYKAIAENNDCSADQVRRRVGDLIKARKELVKKNKATPKREEKQPLNGDLESLISTLIRKVDALDKKVTKLVNSEWIEYDGKNQPLNECEVKVKLSNGDFITGNSNQMPWQTKQQKIDWLNNYMEISFSGKYSESDEHELLRVDLVKEEAKKNGLDIDYNLEHFDFKLDSEVKGEAELYDYEIEIYGKDIKEALRLYRSNYHMAYKILVNKHWDSFVKQKFAENQNDINKPYVIEYQVLPNPNKTVMNKLDSLTKKVNQLLD
ncbi:hypothetical protein L1077_21530 [Pseudoalteromonas luteoviolacea]|uniref:hypothetical protein n=1 Tax=Pseudoalteromonas luteoviolacea TaxID=43657 RepID=UPI001F43E73A|nr:hypothetical protein [Pseudoalteromonas luteoviolacea]MCF6442015.1 hypothetical protein [Pseudoalteromonas luteoviolacea]